jgi:SAM-dependent methyltransferase
MEKDSISFGGGNLPHFYDQNLGPVIFVDYAADMARRVAASKPANVLEIAAGTGIVTRALRDALPTSAKLVATDLSPDMLAIAKTKFASGESLAFQPADAQALPFPDASFDVLACQFGVMFYPDKDKGHREALRVLKPGGRYIFSVWDAHRNVPFARIANELATRLFPADPPQFMKVPFSYGFDAAQDSLVAAGFSDVTAAVVAVDKVIPDTRLFATGVVGGSPFSDQLLARGMAIEPVVDALTTEYERAFGIPGRMPLRAIVFEARKP